MSILPEYEFSNRNSHSHLKRARWLGYLTLTVTLLLILNVHGRPGPGVWCCFGVAVGMQVFLAGIYTMHTTSQKRSAHGEWLVKRSDQWYPVAVFLTQHTFVIVLLLLLWFTLGDVGFPSGFWLSANFIFILLIIPTRHLVMAQAHYFHQPAIETLAELMTCLCISLSTLFVALLLTAFIVPDGGRAAQELPAAVYFVWIPAVLIILMSVVLFVDHASRRAV